MWCSASGRIWVICGSGPTCEQAGEFLWGKRTKNWCPLHHRIQPITTTREAFWMPLRSAAVSRVLRQGFLMPLNRVEKTTYNLRTDTDITKFWDLAHKTRAVTSAIKHIHTYEPWAETPLSVFIQPGVRTSILFVWSCHWLRKSFLYERGRVTFELKHLKTEYFQVAQIYFRNYQKLGENNNYTCARSSKYNRNYICAESLKL